MIAGLWYRLIYMLEMWPFPLGKLGSDEVPPDEQRQVAENLFRCPVEHLEPGLERAVRSAVTTADELLGSPHLLRLIKVAFDKSSCVSMTPRLDKPHTARISG